LKEDLALIESKVERSLKSPVKLMSLVNENDCPIRGRKQDGVQIGGACDGLPQHFMEIAFHHGRNDLGSLRFAASWRADKQSVIELLFILVSGIQRNPNLIDNAFLADQVGERGRSGVSDFVGLFIHGRPLRSVVSAGFT
jgi:hypothetical protein